MLSLCASVSPSVQWDYQTVSQRISVRMELDGKCSVWPTGLDVASVHKALVHVFREGKRPLSSKYKILKNALLLVTSRR